MTTAAEHTSAMKIEDIEVEPGHGILHVLDRVQGDIRISFDHSNPTDVAAARAAWDTAKAKGYMGYQVEGEKGNRSREAVNQFPESAERIIMTPAIQGG